MAEIDFADGFDVAEPLLWGLTPGQVGAAVAGVVLGYLALRSPLPRAGELSLAVLAAGCGLGLALVRVEGRTLVAWLGVAAAFWVRPHRGLLVLEGGGTSAMAPEVAAGEARLDRVRLVLLPRPAGSRSAAGPGGDAGIAAVRTPRRVTFFSLSGGCGRTTLAVEVAGLLAHPGARGGPARGAVLVDLDLLSPRASIRLGVPLRTDWAEALAAEPRSGAAARLLAGHWTGLWVAPGPAAVLVDVDRSADLVGGVAALVGGIERMGVGAVVLDIPAGLGPITRWALEAADDVVVVATPTAGGIQDAYRSTEALRRLGLGHKLRHVVNRGDGGDALAEAVSDLGATILAEIPDDPLLERAEAEHRLVGVEGMGTAGGALRALAAAIDAHRTLPELPGRESRGLLRCRAG
jgi:MinD-like ATPase involved in chromosome partitioning or flagellar assembly